MNYPEFFDKVEPIKLKDPLAQVLGAFENGEYEISYLEVVKAAGHSCPTVAGAYLMTQSALKALYGDERAVRGEIKVAFKEALEDGVAGVIANVITQITGATQKSGFKGLGGRFARHSLMEFEANTTASTKFTRIDTGKSVEVFYNPNTIPPDPQMMGYMQSDPQKFAQLWQERVAKIFANAQEVIDVV